MTCDEAKVKNRTITLASQVRDVHKGVLKAPDRMWSTPNTMDHLPQRSKEALLRQATTTRKGRSRPANLREQVDPETMRLWRTPDAHCDRGAASEKRMKMKLEKKMPISINDQVAHPNLMWPTPTQDSATERTKKYKQGGTPLTLAVKMWPTMTVNDSKNNGGPSQYRRKSHGKPRGLDLNAKVGGALNPTWVEWLMGYKAGYTDLKDWEMLSSRKSRKQ